MKYIRFGVEYNRGFQNRQAAENSLIGIMSGVIRLDEKTATYDGIADKNGDFKLCYRKGEAPENDWFVMGNATDKTVSMLVLSNAQSVTPEDATFVIGAGGINAQLSGRWREYTKYSKKPIGLSNLLLKEEIIDPVEIAKIDEKIRCFRRKMHNCEYGYSSRYIWLWTKEGKQIAQQLEQDIERFGIDSPLSSAEIERIDGSQSARVQLAAHKIKRFKTTLTDGKKEAAK